MNLWYYLCFILLVYNFLLLIDERKLVVYKDEDESEGLNRIPKYSLCFNIKELIENEKLKEDEIYSPKQIIDTLVNSTLICNKDNLNLTSSLIRQHHACIDFKAEKFHLIFPNISNYKFKIFFNPSQETLLYFFEHVYTHNQLKDGFILDIRLVNIRFLPSPFKTNCTRQIDGPAKNNSNKKHYKKVECLLNCHKLSRNSTFFYYDYDEEVQLKLDQKEFILNEKCFEECNYQECFGKIDFFVYVNYDERNNNLPQIETYNDYVVAIPALSSVDFIIQLVSVIVLFLNISLYEILLILIKILKSKFNHRRLLLKVLINSDYVALAICILLLASISAYYIYDYFEFNSLFKSFTEISKEFMPFSVFICLPVQLAYLKNDGQLNFKNEQIFENNSFLEIENRTNVAFKDLIKNSYLKKGGLEIPYQIVVENNTIFRSEEFLVNSKEKLLSRCFKIDLNINEYRYENSLAFTQLILKLNYSNFKIYYTDFNQSLTSNYLQIDRKSIVGLSKYIYLEHPYSSNCKYYNGYCKSKYGCIDFCYNKYYLDNYSSISTESVIYKKDLDNYDLSKAYFNGSEDKKIRNDCTLLHQKKDCEIFDFFNDSYRIEFNGNKSSNNLLIDLYFYKEYFNEIKATTLTMLFFNLLNFETIIVGLNANKALNILINFIKKTLRTRNRKFYALFLISFSLTGFFIHSFFIFNEILTSRLITSESYERLTTIELADFIICFDEIRLVHINEYEKYTGNYLDKLMSNYTFESYFDNITILNKGFRPFTVNAENITSIENRIKVNRSFLFNMNCFQFHTNITYSINDQLRFEEMFFAKIHFKERVYLNDCSCLKFYIAFYEKGKGSFEKLDSHYLRRNNSFNIKIAHLIRPLKIEHDYTDKFYYFSHPLSILKVDS